MDKVLKVVFVILILVLLAEAGYLFYSSKTNNQKIAPIVISNNSILLTPTLATDKVSRPPLSDATKWALGIATDGLNKRILSNSEIINTFVKAKITKITENSGEKTFAGELIVFKIDLSPIDPSGEAYDYYLTLIQEEHDKVVVQQLSKDGKTTPKTMKDLKVGQTIETIQKFSLLDNNKNYLYTFTILP